MHNKKAQIGETLTWVVATLIIIVVLTFSIFIAGIYFEEGKNLKSSFFKSRDVLASKSMFSYLLTPSAEGKVYDQLKAEDNLNEFNGVLALKVFEEFYAEEYLDVWLGFLLDRTLLPFVSNDYFGNRPLEVRGGDISHRTIPHVSEEIYLNENKSIEMVLKVED